ncbi:CAP domain-containing protein [Crassisporium funariophilum]|nr:CAP domain-containing protein [Crassisporium funariophilum]
MSFQKLAFILSVLAFATSGMALVAVEQRTEELEARGELRHPILFFLHKLVIFNLEMTLVDVWVDQVLAQHNSARARYGARPLAWNAALYQEALPWAQSCKFGHSAPQGRYGENLYAATGNPGIADAVNTWMAEASKYNYNQPAFSAATGHFTQIVWKGTTQVACAIAACPAGAILPAPTKYIVCRYAPPGNFEGQFSQNVGRPQ